MINEDALISSDTSLYGAMKIMDEKARKLLLICDDLKFKGLISIGDIQRAILQKRDLTTNVLDLGERDNLIAYVSDDQLHVKEMMKKKRLESMPVIDDDGFLVDIIEWEDIFDNKYEYRLDEPYPVVIMAGGKGTRLHPLTHIIPKPLIPITDKTIIEEIIDGFNGFKCGKIYISINYKAKEIRDYFRENTSYKNIEFVQESVPLGTAGSLFLLRDKINSTFFVSNCDIMADVNYSDMLKYHKRNGNIITMLSVIKEYSIPYGTIDTKDNGVLVNINEKPNMIFQINSGVYILEPAVFSYIEENEFIHITDLINRVILDEKKVGVFPISESSWADIGNWEEYLKVVRKYEKNMNF